MNPSDLRTIKVAAAAIASWRAGQTGGFPNDSSLQLTDVEPGVAKLLLLRPEGDLIGGVHAPRDERPLSLPMLVPFIAEAWCSWVTTPGKAGMVVTWECDSSDAAERTRASVVQQLGERDFAVEGELPMGLTRLKSHEATGVVLRLPFTSQVVLTIGSE